jgi:hypothetical protein
VDRNPFCNVTIVIAGIDPDRNFSLPSGGDGFVKIDNRAASAGFYFLYLKGAVSLVEDRKDMFDYFTFFDDLGVESIFF